MRVNAGKLGGRTFASPHGHRTHPMSDKIRGAVFGVLGDITGLSVLDTFAGSGALAIEALSRGAKHAVAVEADKTAHEVILENIASLELADYLKATRAYVKAWSNRNQNHKFDIIFADPPYDRLPYRDLKGLSKHLAPGGTLVLSWPGKMKPLHFEGLRQVKDKDFGDAQLIFYQLQ